MSNLTNKRYALDTNVASDILDKEQAALTYISGKTILLPIIVIGELYFAVGTRLEKPQIWSTLKRLFATIKFCRATWRPRAYTENLPLR